MASSKEYLDYILEQLSDLDDVSYRAMMGEYIIYYRGKIIGGIYDDRFLVKPTKSAMALMPDANLELPYEGAKEMLLVDDVENKVFLRELLEVMYPELPAVKKKAEEFITKNPQSPISLYLLRRYFLQSVEVDFNKAFQLCSKMLKARPNYLPLVHLHKRLSALSKYRTSGTLPHFSAKDTNGKHVSDSLLKSKANVIMVWASWNSDSQGILRKVRILQREHPKDLSVISICMDVSPDEGARTLRYDSIQWPNICDGKLWDSPMMTQLGFSFVPDNIVVDKQHKIVGRSLRSDQLTEKIESLLKD